MAFQWQLVDWLGLAGSLALVVPPLRMEAAKLRIFGEERKLLTDRQKALKPFRQHLIQCMHQSRDKWRFVDSLFLFAGGVMLALSFLARGFAAAGP